MLDTLMPTPARSPSGGSGWGRGTRCHHSLPSWGPSGRGPDPWGPLGISRGPCLEVPAHAPLGFGWYLFGRLACYTRILCCPHASRGSLAQSPLISRKSTPSCGVHKCKRKLQRFRASSPWGYHDFIWFWWFSKIGIKTTYFLPSLIGGPLKKVQPGPKHTKISLNSYNLIEFNQINFIFIKLFLERSGSPWTTTSKIYLGSTIVEQLCLL
jgi:hypothetical protein